MKVLWIIDREQKRKISRITPPASCVATICKYKKTGKQDDREERAAIKQSQDFQWLFLLAEASIIDTNSIPTIFVTFIVSKPVRLATDHLSRSAGSFPRSWCRVIVDLDPRSRSDCWQLINGAFVNSRKLALTYLHAPSSSFLIVILDNQWNKLMIDPSRRINVAYLIKWVPLILWDGWTDECISLWQPKWFSQVFVFTLLIFDHRRSIMIAPCDRYWRGWYPFSIVFKYFHRIIIADRLWMFGLKYNH